MMEMRADPMLSLIRAMQNMKRETMKAVPAARPSNPSKRFKEFVIATIQKTVMGIDQIPSSRFPKGKVMPSILKAVRVIRRAAMIWKKSLWLGGRPRKSSTAPIPKTMAPAKSSHM
jgi:hypothetical protein